MDELVRSVEDGYRRIETIRHKLDEKKVPGPELLSNKM